MNKDEERDLFIETIYLVNAEKLENICIQYVGYQAEYYGLIDESIQNTFMQAVKNYEELSGFTPSHITAWLLNVCRKRLTTALKTYRRRRTRLIYIEDETELRLSNERLMGATDHIETQIANQQTIDRLLSVLNDRERRIVDQHIMQDMSFEDIAAQEHTTVGAIKGVLARLRAKVKKAAKENPQKYFIIFVSFLQVVRFIK